MQLFPALLNGEKALIRCQKGWKVGETWVCCVERSVSVKTLQRSWSESELLDVKNLRRPLPFLLSDSSAEIGAGSATIAVDFEDSQP